MEKLKLGFNNPFSSAEEQAASLRKEINQLKSAVANAGPLDAFMMGGLSGTAGAKERIASLEKELKYYEELIKSRKKTAATPDAPPAIRQIKFTGEADKTGADNAKKRAEQIQNLRNELIKLLYTEEEIAIARAKEIGATPKQIAEITSLNAAIKEQTKIKEDKKKIDEAEKKAQEDTLQLIKSLNDEYLNLTTTTEELALIKAVANNADYKQIEQLLNITDATKKLKEQQEQMQVEDLAAKNAQEDTLRLIKSLNDEYLNLTNTTEELALIRAVANNADYKQIELLLNITDATKKLKEQQQEQMQVEERAAKNAEAALKNLEAARAEHNAMRENENGLLERYIDLINATDNPLQKFQKAQADLLALREDLIAAGYEQGEVDYRISEAIKKQHQQLMSVDEASKNMDQTYKVLGQTMSSAFEDAIMQAKSYQDILNGILTDIARIILRRTLTDPLQQGFENFMGSFSFGGTPTPTNVPSGNGVTAFGRGARANGGMVTSNTAYLVGERGAEIFVPNNSGTIIPNGQGIGSNVAVNINNYSGQKVETKEVKDSRGNRSITVQIGDAVAQEISRNGSNANMALRTTFNTRPNLVGR
jgi:myosin heavy subunit